jgi:hypothetical protein
VIVSLTGSGDPGGGGVTARGADPYGRGGDHDFVVVANRLPVAVV